MLNKLKNSFFLKIIRKKKYEQKFKNNKDLNLFKGVYSTFQEAEQTIPEDVSSGYNNPDSAQMYKHLANEIFPSDYPNLFWLSKMLKNNSKIFDLGGHIGIKFYSYQKYIDFPENVSWVTQDLPIVIEEGRKFAKENGAKEISFTENIKDFDGVDILFASGSLQYIDFDITKEIALKKNKPTNVLISIPLTELETFYTVNNIGTAYCVYVLRNKAKFINDFERIGYKLLDSWINEGKKCEIPFYPKHSIEGYAGLYFKLV